jgi:tetratricopeptide (TPR) repeat protein/predicted aspartyl protease
MWGRSRPVAIAALALAASFAASDAGAACHLAKYFDLPVDMEGRSAIVTTKINGQDARFEVDTGAFFSMVTPDAAARFKLHGIPMMGLMIEGVGGDATASAAEATEFNFAGVPLKRVQFIVGGRQFAPGTVGLLGENMLSFADVEYDLAHGVMRYFKAEGCAGVGLAYWAKGNYGVIPIQPFQPPVIYHLIGTVKINGHPIRAMFDTGATNSLLARRAAERAGVNMDGPDVKYAGLGSGIGRGVVESWTAPIDSFAIADEEIKNTRLTVGKLDLGDVDMILGMDFFLSHHVYVARSQNKLYFSYNGGPVFRLDQPPPPQEDARPDAKDDTKGAAATPQTADVLTREGEARMSRRDYPGALKALDKAVELDPKSSKPYVDRARAHRMLGKRDAAMADLDQALKLEPDLATARMNRGELLLEAGDVTRAEADFTAAIKASPNDLDLERRVADIFAARERWAEAIAHDDAWIAAHPKDDQLWEALNNRCWSRAMIGKDLDKALDDCNAAVRKGPRNSEVLDSRGLVYLRLGRFVEAIADYDASLKLQPKSPWTLYLRGLAKQRMGKTADGDADIAAARALSPSIDERAKKIGLIDAKPEPAKPEAKPKT